MTSDAATSARGAGAFAGLVRSAGRLDSAFGALARSIEAAARREAGGSRGRDPAAAGDPAAFRRLVDLERERARLGDRALAATAGSVESARDLARAHKGAAARAAGAWGGFADGIAGTLRDLFSRVARDGDLQLRDLWETVGKRLADSLSRVDFGAALDPLFDRAGELAGALFAGDGKGLARGLAGAVSGLFGAAGGGGALGFLGGPAAGLLSVGAGLLERLFRRKPKPVSAAAFGLEDGRLGEAAAYVRDGADPGIAASIGAAVRGIVNPFLDALGASLAPGAFAGQAGFVRGSYRTTPRRRSLLPWEDDSEETLGVPGVASDLRDFGGNRAAAVADFTARSLLDALSRGALRGLSDEAAETLRHGLRNLAAGIDAEDYDEERLAALPRRLEFLATFDETVRLYRDGAAALGDYNAMLAAQRAALARSAGEGAEAAVGPIRDFLADAAALLGEGPAGGADGGGGTAGRIAEAAGAARGMALAALGELAAAAAPAEPPLQGLALLYETQKARIEALRPELEKLNADLTALGEGAIDIDAAVRRAGDALLAGARERFSAQLGDALDPRGAALRALGAEIEGLRAQAAGLGLGEDEGTRTAIDRLYARRLADLGYELDASGAAVRTFAAEIEGAGRAVERESRRREALAAAARAAVESLEEARRGLRLDRDLGLLSPLEALAARRARFESVADRAGDAALPPEERDAARLELGRVAREYLESAREVHASTGAYAEIFERVDGKLARTLDSAREQASAAERQLSVLVDIRDALLDDREATGRLAPVSWRTARDGQGVATSSGVVPAGFDLGYRPERAVGILVALAAAGLPLPSGFGEGQLTRLREGNAAVDRVVAAVAHAGGGVMTALGPAAPDRRGAGGIARLPRVALFGEGRLPEAYVPLPDGRSIPVALRAPANDEPAAARREADARAGSAARETVGELRRLRAGIGELLDQNRRLERLLARALAGRDAAGRAA